MSELVRVLCICTHNRTRSVMMECMLGKHAAERGQQLVTASAGFRAAGEPATEPTIRLLADRGIDVAAHHSRTVSTDLVADFDLVLTAEAAHVVQLAGATPELFRRTFTLPEFVTRAHTADRRGELAFGEWLDRMGTGRPIGLDYLDAVDGGAVGEVADPTGRGPREWAVAIDTIDQLTAAVAEALA